MKKVFVVVLAIVLAMSTMPLTAFAASEPADFDFAGFDVGQVDVGDADLPRQLIEGDFSVGHHPVKA